MSSAVAAPGAAMGVARLLAWSAGSTFAIPFLRRDEGDQDHPITVEESCCADVRRPIWQSVTSIGIHHLLSLGEFSSWSSSGMHSIPKLQYAFVTFPAHSLGIGSH